MNHQSPLPYKHEGDDIEICCAYMDTQAFWGLHSIP